MTPLGWLGRKTSTQTKITYPQSSFHKSLSKFLLTDIIFGDKIFIIYKRFPICLDESFKKCVFNLVNALISMSRRTTYWTSGSKSCIIWLLQFQCLRKYVQYKHKECSWVFKMCTRMRACLRECARICVCVKQKSLVLSPTYQRSWEGILLWAWSSVLLSVRPSMHHAFEISHNFGAMYARILKFHMCIAYKILAGPYFLFLFIY